MMIRRYLLEVIRLRQALGRFFLAGLPKNNSQAVVAFFGASQAAINGRDILKINDVVVSTPELASAEKSIIAMFMYDKGDGVTSYNPDPTFAAFPFLNGIDVFFSNYQSYNHNNGV
jgi:hypothetical protein